DAPAAAARHYQQRHAGGDVHGAHAQPEARPQDLRAAEIVARAVFPLFVERGVCMRYALLALLFPAVAWAGGDNEAEKLFRQLEKKIRAAKAVRIVADITGSAKGTDVKFHIEMTLAEGNKARVKMKGEVKKEGGDEKLGAELVSDGTNLRMSETTSGKTKDDKAPEGFSQKLALLVGRVGLIGGLRTGVGGGKKGEKEPDLEKLLGL